ncbi:uncharacterized protein B0H18DRAFT_376966 [Fomitopsis serialis]|uniref:uncharacterized protein n=1 Tax=Fomitopsis serialis TaxID=139415 RepID=UPI002008E0BB|nr:uncharacterized protein B0H18DRAFT_376966 [Neoantrodia serialis]KAH9925570.1 hypothetical protein B0H18DRAFT_376966 [Neoantrodia serialis]
MTPCSPWPSRTYAGPGAPRPAHTSVVASCRARRKAAHVAATHPPRESLHAGYSAHCPPPGFGDIIVVPILDAYTVVQYMNVVTPLISRWRSLDIRFDAYAPQLWSAALSACCAQSPATHVPFIRELTLIYPGNDDTREFVLFNGSAPRLRRVTLCGIRLSWTRSLFQDLAYLDYTHHGFTRGQDAAAEVLAMLRVSSHLHELRLSFPWRGDSHSVSPHSVPLTVVLPRLLTLVLTVEGPEIPNAFLTVLAHVSCPALRTLRLYSTYPFLRPSLFPRLRHVSRVLPPLPALEVLHIEHGWLDPRFIFPLLLSLPRLRHLTLKGVRVTGPFLVGLAENLSARRAHTSLASRLKVLEVIGCDLLGADVVQAFRLKPGWSRHGIETILIRDCPGVGPTAIGKLGGLGMDVTIWPAGGRGESGTQRKVLYR